MIEPASGEVPGFPILLHTYPGQSRSLNGQLGESRLDAAAGDVVRLRVINTDNAATVAWVAGAPMRVVAVDGVDLTGGALVSGRKVLVTAGGRVDLEVTVPAGGVRLQVPGVSLAVGGRTRPPSAREFVKDLLTYGSREALPFDPESPDKRLEYSIGRLPGFLDGMSGIWWSINGRIGKNVPMYVVAEGDVVRMTISNHSGEAHPMHLHGHHLLVLSRNGVPATGAQWWVDSLHVDHGETYEIAFVADNPGIWMDHCHNLPHAKDGLMAHVMYDGVTTPYLLGRGSGNEPE